LPAAEWPEDRTNDGGLLILSRYPIVERDFHAFRSSHLSHSLKGVLFARIKLKEDVFASIFNTHLEAS